MFFTAFACDASFLSARGKAAFMMTLQELKQSVETVVPGQKIPTAKNIRESGVAVAKEKLDGDTEITAYRNGYALYSNCRVATVFPIHTCGGYVYGGSRDACSIEEKLFDREVWYLRLVLEGEDRLAHNREMKERKKTVSSSTAAEEWDKDEITGDRILEQMILEEMVTEALSVLTGQQRMAVTRFYLQQKTQGQIAEELDVTVSAVSKLISRAVCRMRRSGARA